MKEKILCVHSKEKQKQKGKYRAVFLNSPEFLEAVREAPLRRHLRRERVSGSESTNHLLNTYPIGFLKKSFVARLNFLHSGRPQESFPEWGETNIHEI